MIKVVSLQISHSEEFNEKLVRFGEGFFYFSFKKIDSNLAEDLLCGTFKGNENLYFALHVKTFSDLLLYYNLQQIIDLLELGMELIVEDEPLLSTFHFGLVEWEGKIEETITYGYSIDCLLAVLKAVSQITTQSRGRSKAKLSKEFAEDYWKWQLGKISVKEIMNNKTYSFGTTAQFYSLAKRYESSFDYGVMLSRFNADLIKNKKHGKIDLATITDIIEKNSDSSLTPKIIEELMNKLNVFCIDLWRTVRAYTLTKKYCELPESELKSSLSTVIKLIDDFDSDFFTCRLSLEVTFSSNYAESVKNILKKKDEYEKMPYWQKIKYGMINITDDFRELTEEEKNRLDEINQ